MDWCCAGDTNALARVDNAALKTLLLFGNHLACTAYDLNNATNLAGQVAVGIKIAADLSVYEQMIAKGG